MSVPPTSAPLLDFEQFFNASPNPYMVLDRSLRYVAANDAYVAVTGRAREDLLGQYLFEVFPGSPDELEDLNVQMVRASLERVLETGTRGELPLIPYTIPVRRGDETIYEEKFWSATHTPILDNRGDVAYILQHTVDVTEILQTRKALHVAETALEASGVLPHQAEEGLLRRVQAVQETNRTLGNEHARLRRLFQQAPSIIAIMRGPDHVFELTNDAYDEAAGHRSLLGLPVVEALPEMVDQGFVRLLDQVYASGQPFVGRGVEVHVRRKADGPLDTLYVDFIYQPILEADGSVYGIFVEGHDVTEQVEAQRQLRALNASLETRVAQRTTELEVRNRELQEFAHVASHDLQEPLRKIQSFADLLILEKRDQLDEEALHFTERMQAAAARMSRLISDLLTFSRITTRGESFTRVDLDEILEGVLTDLDLRLRETQGSVHAASLGTLTADPLQMQQALLNLIGNGLKFHRHDTPPVIHVSREDRDGYARVTIADNGIGIPRAQLDKIFMPFKRLHGIGRFEGTGMGLAIVRRIAERHGGSVEVSSAEDEGTAFTIVLPLHPSRVEGASQQVVSETAA